MTASFGSRDGSRILGMVQPEYPLRARRLQREGRGLLQLHLDRTGELRTAKVVEAAGYGFDGSALAAVRSSLFAPASRIGVQVACQALRPVRFELRER